MQFVTLHNRHQNGDPHGVRPDLVNNVHQEADGTVRVVIMFPGPAATGAYGTYELDPTEDYATTLAILNAGW